MTMTNLSATRRKIRRSQRLGISILEVITAIMVAVIGVFGVVAIIPFAIRQAEMGLNQEDSINAARNVQQRFETMGLKDSNRWFFGDATAVPAGNRGGFGIDPDVRAFCIDPVGISYSTSPQINEPYTTYGRFPRVPSSFILPAGFPALVYDHNPFTGAKTAGPLPGLPRVTFLDRNNNIFDRALAAQVFGYENDLVHAKTNERALPPDPQFFRSGGINHKRMTEGNVSCMTFIVGKGMTSNEYTMYTVVFRKRLVANSDRIFQVDSATSNLVLPGNTTSYGGGDLVVNELTTPAADAKRIGRNEWIMMLNADPTQPGTIRSLQYFRLTESYETNSGQTTFSLIGGDFELSDGTTNFPTFLIYMPDVLAVYENTFRFESKSNWN